MILNLEDNEVTYLLSVLGGRPFNEVASTYMKIAAQKSNNDAQRTKHDGANHHDSDERSGNLGSDFREQLGRVQR